MSGDANRRRPWADIHDDYKLTDRYGARWVLVWDSQGSVLVRWVGP